MNAILTNLHYHLSCDLCYVCSTYVCHVLLCNVLEISMSISVSPHGLFFSVGLCTTWNLMSIKLKICEPIASID